ncbi:3-oxoadipate enol-lactonase [Wenxinia marina]|uniref:3-oxoadipate enol-lactonase n=1 Tax=Wenxinia marina DSM 24838 TaxID=1123501 RepID=A0A0D0QEB7_9RHOB|nr:3-oxoadipate enol-lactonase [Wenxinia marina]KIQ70682.1 3-oxoadipate enol-lactonase [Wenxinia marina DSM 24838]GGL51358.1 3-oxoadipate enol-lactonase [Wenxinia marina]
MDEKRIDREGVTLYSRADGAEDPAAPTLVFANSLGTDLTLWDQLLPLLPRGLRFIRWDKRGHGQSDVPPAPYHMGTLVTDAAAVCDAWDVRDGVFVGLSIGGLIAQGLAVKRPDVMRAVVLSNTGAKIGTPQLWDDRIAAIRKGGLEAMADGVMERWFSRPFRESPQVRPWRDLLVSTPVEGYLGCCAAISGTDFWSTTASLRLPALGIAGSEDGATPPDLVRETVDLIPGSRFELIRGAGHLPCVEAPEEYARILTDFLRGIGEV